MRPLDFRLLFFFAPPRDPAADFRADDVALRAPERAPVAAALVARRAVFAALRAVERVEVLRAVLDLRVLDLRELDLRDEVDEDFRAEVVDDLRADDARRRLEEPRRRPPLCAR